MKKISFTLTPNSRNFVSLRGRQNMVRADLFSGSLAVWKECGEAAVTACLPRPPAAGEAGRQPWRLRRNLSKLLKNRENIDSNHIL